MRPNRIIGIIPARGKSTGILRKNLRLLAGKPLIHHMIESAKQASRLDHLYVSTDSDEIADYAKSLDVETILHPASLSADDAPTFGVIQNALAILENSGARPYAVATLRATSPLCLPLDIDEAVDILLANSQSDAVLSVVKAPVHPYRILRINDSGELVHDGFTTELNYPRRRQSFPPVYIRNGAIYASRANTIRRGGLWGTHTLPYIMPPERSVNINEEIDIVLAEALLGKK